MLVAPRTSTPSGAADMRTSSSFFRRRDASDSESERLEQRASTSSMKTMEGVRCDADSKSARTSFSDSPTHLETRSDEEIEKKVASTSVATALARWVLPVPGGPYSRMPRHGRRSPVKRLGKRNGSTTASWRAALAASRPATSSQRTLGFSVMIAFPSSSCCSLLSPPLLLPPAPLPVARPVAPRPTTPRPPMAPGLPVPPSPRPAVRPAALPMALPRPVTPDAPQQEPRAEMPVARPIPRLPAGGRGAAGSGGAGTCRVLPRVWDG
mmetsp:Transcript_475/g.1217  ORF Transcript_475/g.1217 Transcript_475/m.1217 type:complete len:267 (-) Transcript_475:413-1213(-)